MEEVRDYNEKYTGEYTSRIAFPIGGLGTGMFCVEGSGAISNMNIRHKTEMLNEPTMFAGLYLKGVDNGSIVGYIDLKNKIHFSYIIFLMIYSFNILYFFSISVQSPPMITLLSPARINTPIPNPTRQ